MTEHDASLMKIKLERDTNEIKREFSRLLFRSQKSLEKISSLDDVISVLVHQDDEGWTKKCSSISQVFQNAKKFCSFYNTGTLRLLLTELGTEPDKNRYEDYKKKFQIYCKRRVCLCTEKMLAVVMDKNIERLGKWEQDQLHFEINRVFQKRPPVRLLSDEQMQQELSASRQNSNSSTASRQTSYSSTASRQDSNNSTACRQDSNNSTASRQDSNNSTACRQDSNDSTACRQDSNDSTACRQDSNNSTASRQDSNNSTACRRDSNNSTACRQDSNNSTACCQDSNNSTACRQNSYSSTFSLEAASAATSTANPYCVTGNSTIPSKVTSNSQTSLANIITAKREVNSIVLTDITSFSSTGSSSFVVPSKDTGYITPSDAASFFKNNKVDKDTLMDDSNSSHSAASISDSEANNESESSVWVSMGK